MKKETTFTVSEAIDAHDLNEIVEAKAKLPDNAEIKVFYIIVTHTSLENIS